MKFGILCEELSSLKMRTPNLTLKINAVYSGGRIVIFIGNVMDAISNLREKLKSVNKRMMCA